jgi:hypothetical protein
MPATLDQLRAKYPNLSDDAIAGLADVTLQLQGDQKTRKPFLNLFKAANPQTPVPEIDEPARVEAIVAEDRKAREAFEQRIEQRFAQEDLTKTRNDVASRFGLSAEDMTAMEKMMTEKKLPADYTWAAQLYRQQTETSTPTNYGAGGAGRYDLEASISADKSYTGLMDNPDAWTQRTAHEMVDQMRASSKQKQW